jgi:hypothetical protein
VGGGFLGASGCEPMGAMQEEANSIRLIKMMSQITSKTQQLN